MLKVNVQRELAARVLKVGVNRIWIDPEREEEVAMAITRSDIQGLIRDGAIRKRYKKGVSRARARKIHEKKKRGKRKGEGSRKGKKTAKISRKESWMLRIRPIRRELKNLRARRMITPTVYRRLYLLASGGTFKNVPHLTRYISEKNLYRRK
ncbi:MAG: 50S ribosomal protein L19e [Candidatus Helarchaeales archaeon]